MATANEKAIKSACDWAVKIAKDNNFHYGRTKWAHKYGCYFCGTQSAKKNAAPASQKSEVSKTYCCNPFVVAAYVHGAGVAKKCGSGGLTVPLAGGSTKNLKKYNFKKVTKRAIFFSHLHTQCFMLVTERYHTQSTTITE